MAYSAKVKQWRAAAAANPRGFVERRLRIPDLMGRDVEFKYNFSQRRFSEVKQYLLKEGKPVRLWVGKFRRAGITSVESAESYAHTWGKDNSRVGVIAHLEDRAKEILSNYKGYDKSLNTFYPDLEQKLSKDNIFGIKFEDSNSQVLIGTAENPIKIRGDGIHILDGSEAAHWLGKFRRVTKEVCPVVPPRAGSMIIYESTGTFIGSAPHEHYEDAVRFEDYLAGKRGRNEFIRLFLCWLKDPEQVIHLPTQKDYDELFELIYQSEPRLSEKNKHYKLTPEQIAKSWEMYFYQADNDFDWFCREFPYREEEMWSAGGASYFGAHELDIAQPVDPLYVFQFNPRNVAHIFTDLNELERVGEIADYAPFPNLKVWKLPDKNSRYALGSDSASGDYAGDPSAGYLRDIHTRELMCSYHGWITPDESAHINVALARMYNNAIIGPETNPGGGGMEALNSIQRLGYHNIYQWRIRDGNKGVAASTKLGWWTQPRSRALMLGNLRKLLHSTVHGKIRDSGIFKDGALLREMRTFSTNPETGVPEAMKGAHDDRVMADAICNQICDDEVYCTSKDLLYDYHKYEPQRPPIDQAKLVQRQQDPAKVMANFLNPSSNFNRNKFEI